MVSIEWMNHWKQYALAESDTEAINLFPGHINNPSQLTKMCLVNKNASSFLPMCDDFMNNLVLKSDQVDDEDFVTLNDEEFEFLFSLYGGTDIRRIAVQIKINEEIPSGSPEEGMALLNSSRRYVYGDLYEERNSSDDRINDVIDSQIIDIDCNINLE